MTPEFPARLRRWRRERPELFITGVFLLLAVASLALLDLQVHAVEPWQELARIGRGLLTPRWEDWPVLGRALLNTVAFALCAVTIAVVTGGVLSLFYRLAPVRVACAAVRAVHEVFWGLLLMQFLGLSALTGVLAIAIPYSAIFARVFADIYAEQSPLPQQVLARHRVGVSRWCYTVLAQGWWSLCSYVRYRFECALRASAILGFIGLPTLGFHFETALKQGSYSEAACLLWIFYLLIAGLRWWLQWRLLPVYCVVAFLVLPDSMPVSGSFLWEFLSRDIWPAALREGNLTAALRWYGTELWSEALPAALQTVALSLVALVASGLLVLLLFPLAARPCAGRLAPGGHALLVFLRATPELMLAFVFLLLFGPSALPAIIALALHNGGLIAYLAAREADRLPLRPDAAGGANLWAYEMVPRLYPRISALLLYRWEVILRESAILGILGVTTLGFYVDSAFAEFRMDRALLLLLVTAGLNIAVDALSQRINRTLRHESAQSIPVR
ncbi:PhnE/PtxC family ABC transporter permease [Haliea sp. E17]|uniref:PhnE/PtxC family ABC transporter permease n=1 Tax=Haliea sp. E17 TaxID=3401576 RepID=UPI003AAC448A